MTETQSRSRKWMRPLVGALVQFVCASALLALGHTLPGVLLVSAGLILLISALRIRARSARPPRGHQHEQ